MRAYLFVVLSLVATLAVAAPGAADERGDLEIVALSNRADLVWGGDVLLEVRLPEDVDADDMRVDAGGRDVTSAFAVREDGRFIGLVDGLSLGATTITATAEDSAARLDVTNHPVGGPIFSGPQIQPWYCLPGAEDAQCNRPVRYEWFYKTKSDGAIRAYDPANPPAESDITMTVTDQGETVPYVYRIETGTLNRNQYKIAVLVRPEDVWSRWEGPPAWNHKVYALHGAGCSMGHSEGNAGAAQNVAGEHARAYALTKGFAVMAVVMADNTYSCNAVVQAESTMMVKEHLIETYGDVRYLIGSGGSGGSMAQLLQANAYPGLYDGLIVNATFPDVPINDLGDCRLLVRYWASPLNWSPGVVWTEPQQAAASGHASTSVCRMWDTVYHYTEVFNPRTGVGCHVTVNEPARVYHPQNNPSGVRCSWQDYLGNIFGARPQDRWGPVEQGIGAGFANRPYDNVGVQYGLEALLDRLITPAQFVDLNTRIGGIDIDYAFQPARVEADPAALTAAYRAGVVNGANYLDQVAIIDIPGGSPVGSIPGDRYEIHDNYKSWALRERLDAANGHHDNHVIWYGLEGSPPRPYDLFLSVAFTTMDQWLTTVERDERDVPLEQKIVDDRPAAARDQCDIPHRTVCDAAFGPAGHPRRGAGAELANDVLKCELQPLEPADYAPIVFTAAEWAALQGAFPSGVCDWTRPGVEQQPTVGWQSYAQGPGGRPLGPRPASVASDSLDG